MTKAIIEHINITVSDVERSVAMLETLFGWKVRWKGPAKDGGITAHVGDKNHYLALYSKGGAAARTTSYEMPGGLIPRKPVSGPLASSRTAMRTMNPVDASISMTMTPSNMRS